MWGLFINITVTTDALKDSIYSVDKYRPEAQTDEKIKYLSKSNRSLNEGYRNTEGSHQSLDIKQRNQPQFPGSVEVKFPNVLF